MDCITEKDSWTLLPETLRRYVNPVFAETGTYLGGAIAVALQVGFEQVHSVDIEPSLYQNAQRLYGDDTRVHLYLGDAATELRRMIRFIQKPITFWLDAHDIVRSTLWEELRTIADHPLKGHTILIDDRQWWKNWGIEEASVLELLLSVNPFYEFRHEPNRFSANDIFVATVTKNR